MITTKEILKLLIKDKKKIQWSKNALWDYSSSQRFELIKIQDKIDECKRILFNDKQEKNVNK